MTSSSNQGNKNKFSCDNSFINYIKSVFLRKRKTGAAYYFQYKYIGVQS